ncbi:hypothetical protein EON65_20610 [archaeon]|nr:MAG: hypothetical protein EON65_20610 [archaeon]
MSMYINKRELYEQHRETVMTRAAETDDQDGDVNDVMWFMLFKIIDANKDRKLELEEIYQALKLLGQAFHS